MKSWIQNHPTLGHQQFFCPHWKGHGETHDLPQWDGLNLETTPVGVGVDVV